MDSNDKQLLNNLTHNVALLNANVKHLIEAIDALTSAVRESTNQKR